MKKNEPDFDWQGLAKYQFSLTEDDRDFLKSCGISCDIQPVESDQVSEFDARPYLEFWYECLPCDAFLRILSAGTTVRDLLAQGIAEFDAAMQRGEVNDYHRNAAYLLGLPLRLVTRWQQVIIQRGQDDVILSPEEN